MGFISRKLLPACGNMCVCCPALRPSSQHPVKRYRKLLSQIFPKNFDGPPNDRKILKLCEYAARNPLRLPKIAKFLEQRSYKELRSDHANYIKIIAETYCKLLLTCKEQIAYFAASLLNVILELLDDKRAETVHVVGLQTLTQFIYSQGDATYAHSIENLAHRVCEISRKEGSSRLLKAASLESLSATAWFMREFSHLFAGLDEIIIVALENYDSERHVSRPNWVNEVTGLDIPRITDASLLTREESEQPGVWAKICIQRIIEYAKENSTMRRILEPVFIFIDSRKLWIPDNDLSMTIFSDISNLVNGSGKEQTLVSAIIRHLDHKNITQEPKLKSNILQIAAGLIKELRSKKSVPEVGVVSDLCRHLRKSLQTTVEVAAVEESGSSLQTSIHSCLLEIAKGIEDARPLFDMMAITLEDLPQIAVHSKAMIGSLLILAHIISVTVRSRSETVFPEALLLQLLKVMMHPDPETRVGAHQIFSILLVRNPTRVAPDGIFEARKFQTKTTSAFTSASALLEKLRREKEFLVSEENEIIGEHSKLSGPVLEERAQEVSIAVLSEDQISQLLSAFWIQANQEDNFPFNFEAIAHSFSLTLLSSRLKSVNQNILASFFQLPLSLRKISLDSKGYLPVHQRSVFSISTAMLGFAGKIYRVPELTEFLKSSKFAYDDPFLNISDEFQINVKSHSDLRDYNSEADQRAAAASLSILKKSTDECDGSLPLILLRALSRLTDLGVDSLNKLMSECFTPDDGLLFGPKFAFNWARTPELAHSEESLSLDEDCGRASCVSGDVTSASPALHHHRFISKKNNLPSLPQVISVGQLLESALQVAGQVAGTCISTSPLPYGTMASQCEALGEGTRKKFSHWLGSSDSLEQDQPRSALHALSHLSLGKERSNLGLDMNDEGFPRAETCTTLRLPPASPFDNFWKAARY